MFAAVELQFVEPAQLVALGGAFGADEPQPRAFAREMVLCRALAMRIIRVGRPSCDVTTG